MVYGYEMKKAGQGNCGKMIILALCISTLQSFLLDSDITGDEYS